MPEKKQDKKVIINIIIGTIFILASALVLIYFNPGLFTPNIELDSAIDQKGFAPVFVPSGGESASVIIEPMAESALIPDRIQIEKIGLDASVKVAETIEVRIDGKDVTQFLIPEEFAAGWHANSAPLGEVGNTVISGHHNAYGKVFEQLDDLKEGDTFTLSSDGEQYTYIILRKLIRQERDQPLEVRLENGRWLLPSDDERVTLVTCWPKNTNTHRLILVAVPASSAEAD